MTESPPLLIISSSLNPSSRSRVMAEAARHDAEAAGATINWLDLAAIDLPLCDGGATFAHESVANASERIRAAKGIIVASPVYNYDVNAALKNLLELTGRHWTGKVVGLLCAAGGQSSYMSLMPFANSLMLDFRCVVVPRFVYATGSHFEGPDIADTDLRERLRGLVIDTLAFSQALDGLTEHPPEG